MVRQAWWIANLKQPGADYDFLFVQEGLDVPAKVQDAARKVNAGQSLNNDETPRVLRLSDQGHDGEQIFWPCNAENIPSIFQIQELWFVSKKLKDVLSEAYAPETGYEKVELLDRVGDPIKRETWFLNPRNLKNAFSPHQCEAVKSRLTGFGLSEDLIIQERASFYAYKDDDIILNDDAREGAQIWVEANYLNTFFVSDALHKRLIDTEEFSDINFIRSPIAD